MTRTSRELSPGKRDQRASPEMEAFKGAAAEERRRPESHDNGRRHPQLAAHKRALKNRAAEGVLSEVLKA